MRRIRKLKKSIKGISPIISTLLLIAIAVVASLVVYLWVMGYLSAKTSTAGDSIMIPSFTSTNGYLTVYVQNTGQGIVHLNPSGSFYVNSTAEQVTQENGTTTLKLNFPISIGQTVGFVTNCAVQPNDEVTIKAVTTEGVFIQVSGIVQGPATANYFTVSSTSGTQVAGTAFSVTVTATYPSGSPDTTYTGTVNFTSTDPKAVLPADYTFTAADAGVHTFTNAVTLKTAGTQSVTVTDTSTKITGSESISVSHAVDAVSVGVSPSTDSVTAGATVTYTATAKDTYGNTWDASSTAGWSGGGGPWSGATLTTQTSGTFTITATLPTASGTAQLTVNAGALASVKVSGTSSVTAGGQATFTATGYDSEGNSLGAQTASWSIQSGAGGSWASNVYTSQYSGSWTVTATVSGFTGTAQLTVNAGSAKTLAFSSIANPQVAGKAFSVTITAQDAYGNTATSYTGTAALTDLNGPVSPATAKFTTGVWTGSVNITRAIAEDALFATDSVTSSIKGESGLFTVNPSSLNHFAFSPITSPEIAGSTFIVDIIAEDAYGNAVPSFTGTAALTDLSGSISPTSTGAFTAGVWTGNVNITKAYTNDVITATNSADITGQSGPFNVYPSSANHFGFGVISSPQVAGANITVTITAEDAYNNTVPNYTGTATLSDLTGYMTPTSTGAFAAGVWTGNVNITKAYTNDVITATDSTNDLTGHSGSFTVSPGALASFTFGSIGSSQTAGIAFSVTVTAYDQYGNVETGYTGPAAFNDQTGTLTSKGSWSAGVWTGTMNVTKVYANDYITVTDSTSTPAVTGNSGYFTVIPGPLASFTISSIGTNIGGGVYQVTAGKAFSVTITAYDQYGNVVTSYPGTATLVDTSGTLTNSGSWASGVWTGTMTITKANNGDIVTVTDTSGVKATSNAFNVIPGPLDKFVIGNVGTQAPGADFYITVTAEDAEGNVNNTYTGSVVFTDLSGTIAQIGSGAFNSGVLNAEVVITKAYTNDVITATDSVSGATGKSNAFNVVSGGSSDPATKLFYTAGTDQSVTIDTVSIVITVQLQDPYGNPVNAGTGGVSVTLTALIGTTEIGTFYSSPTTPIATGPVTITIPAGSSSASFYFYDTLADTPTLTAASTGLTSAVTTIAFNSYKLVFTTGASQSVGVNGLSTAISVERETAAGVETNYGGTFYVTLSTNSTTGEFENAEGEVIHSIEIGHNYEYYTDEFYYIDTVAGTPTLSASYTGFTTGTTTFTIYNPVLTKFTFNTISSPQKTGTAFSITITAVDQNGHTDTAFTGTAALSSSQGTITTPTGSFTAGVWTGSVTITGTITTLTSTNITATSGSATGTSNSFNLYTPQLISFSVTSSTSTPTVGQAFTLTITALDQDGHTYTGYTGTNTLTASPETISPQTTGAFTAGVCTVRGVTLTPKSVSVTITTSDGNGHTGTITVTVSPGALASFTVTGYPTSVTAGSSFPNPIVVTAYDHYGNVATNFEGTVTFSSSDTNSHVNLPNPYTFTAGDDGTYSFAGSEFTLCTAPSQNITVTSGAVSETSNPSITVTAGAFYGYKFSQIGGTTDSETSGAAFAVAITQVDQYGNTVTTQHGTGTPTIEATGLGTHGSVTSSGWTFLNGVWTGQVTITDTYGATTVALYVQNYETEENSNTFAVIGSLYQFVFSAVGTSHFGVYTVDTGTSYSVTITAEDEAGNTVTSFGGAETIMGHGLGTDTISTPTSGSITFTGGVWTGSIIISGTASETDAYLYISGYPTLDESNAFNIVG